MLVLYAIFTGYLRRLHNTPRTKVLNVLERKLCSVLLNLKPSSQGKAVRSWNVSRRCGLGSAHPGGRKGGKREASCGP